MFKPYLKAGKWGIRFLNIFASPVLRGVSKVLGKQVMEDFAGFMHLWDDIMFEGFSRRATEVKALLAGNETLFLAVATPQRLPMNESVFLYNKLISNQMPFGGFIINRVNLSASHNDTQKLDINNLFTDTAISSDLKEKLITVHQNIEKLSQSDARSVQNLVDTIGSEESVFQIPIAEGEITNLDDLYRLSQQF
jgi:anion-transporting  ArsA/GET3 family ATPase